MRTGSSGATHSHSLLLESLLDGGKDDEEALAGAEAIATGLGVDQFIVYGNLKFARGGGGGLGSLQLNDQR